MDRVHVYNFAQGPAGVADALGGRGANPAETAWPGLPEQIDGDGAR